MVFSLVILLGCSLFITSSNAVSIPSQTNASATTTPSQSPPGSTTRLCRPDRSECICGQSVYKTSTHECTNGQVVIRKIDRVTEKPKVSTPPELEWVDEPDNEEEFFTDEDYETDEHNLSTDATTMLSSMESTLQDETDTEPTTSSLSQEATTEQTSASSNNTSKVHNEIWVEAKNGKVPPNAIVGGIENHKPVYIARIKTQEGDMVPSKLVQSRKEAAAPYWGVRTSSVYQVLTESDPTRSFKWVMMNGSQMPEGAFLAGTEKRKNLYIGRVHHVSGSILLGKYHGPDRTLYYVHNEREKRTDRNLEILCVS